MDTVLTILILILLVGWLYLRRGQRQGPATSVDRRPKSGNTAYHSVSILYSATACTAARELEGRRFLADAAPRLPLPECDMTNCECRFVHYQDRRATQDRRSTFTAAGHSAATGDVKAELRDTAERRDEDDPLA